MISGNYTNYNNQMNNVSYGAVKDVVPESVTQKLPENIQNLDAKEVANSNGAISTMNGADSKTLLATLPVYASFVGLRSLNDNPKSKFTFAGDYSKSILGKLGNLGDKIAGLVPKKLRAKASGHQGKIRKFLFDHSAVARSVTTPLRLENSFAISEANGLFSRVMTDNSTMFEKGFNGDVKALFKGDGTSKFWKFLQGKGIDSADAKGAKKIVSEAFREIGEMPVKSSEVQGYADDIIKALSKSGEKITIDKWGKLPIGKIPGLGKALTLNVPMSEISNKLKVASGVGGATALGKALPSGFAKVYEGLTSNFVGGKLAPLLQAWFLASAAIKAKDAPEGQKLATFMDEEAGAVAVLFTMPFATKILTHAGGLKYIGMGKDKAGQEAGVKAYREAIKNLNDRIDAKSITRGEYLDEVKKIKDMLKGKGEGGVGVKFWQKPLKAIGKVLGSNYKRETIKPFIDDVVPSDMGALKSLGVSVSNKVKNALYGFKTGKIAGMTPGGILRFAIVFLGLSSLLSKPIKAVVNKIFGKPYDPEKEKEEQEKLKQEEMMKNNPFLHMTDQEMLNLLSKNQDTLEKIQNDPQLMKELQQNPQKLYEMLQEGVKQKDEALRKAGPSPVMQDYINRQKAQNQAPAQGTVQPSNTTYTPNMQQNMQVNNNGMNFNTNSDMPTPSIQPTSKKEEENKPVEPKRTYIPSSKPADFSAQQQAQDARFNSIIADMEKTEQEYSKYLSI